MGHKYGIGDVVYSTIWNEKVRIREIKDNLFYVVNSLKSQSWMLTHELNLKGCEDEIDKMMQEHQEICDDILAIQNIDISEFEIFDEYVKNIDMVDIATTQVTGIKPLEMEFKCTGGPYGDCTASFDVELNRECTFRELIDLILTRNEWGYIGKEDPREVFGYPRFEYSYDHIKEDSERGHFTEEDYNRNIKVVKAHGGWSRMDYWITFE